MRQTRLYREEVALPNRVAQRKALQRSIPKRAATALVDDTLNSPGQPLDPETRAFMEPRFGHDFSRVRVHADSRAAESAQAVNAMAYTVGRDIVFGAGQYVPGASEARRLLGHELTHVTQQAGSQSHGLVQRRVVVQYPDEHPPRAPATATNASIVSDYASTLCSGFSVDASGVLNPPSDTFCTGAATSSTPESCRCLCKMTSLRNTAGDEVEWKVFVADKEWPGTIPETRSVYVHSPYSGMQFGAWTAGPDEHRMTADNWLVFGHELCGHAWLYERGRHRKEDIVIDEGLWSHNPMAEIQNEIAAEHGLPASERRGLWEGGRHHGESLASVTIARYPSGRAEFYAAPADERAKLDIVHDFMTSSPSMMADVIGHADQPASTSRVNERISRQRAESVQKVLEAGHIDRSRFITVEGKSDTECPAPGDQPLCRKVVIYMFRYRAATERRR